MRYTIRVDYRTGDSFGSEETWGELGISWEKLEVAKEALRRITELDKAERYNDSLRWKDGQPIDLSTLKSHSPKYSQVCMMFPLDDGSEHRDSTPWRGYFETLRSAEIVPVQDTKELEGLKYTA